MQTFLPYPDFYQSAAVLDRRRLGKQRVETMQIMQALTGKKLIKTVVHRGEILTLSPSEWRLVDAKPGWMNHSATRMWRGYEHVLLEYQKAVVYEWTQVRGYLDNCLRSTYAIYGLGEFQPAGEKPPWLGNEAFHRSHQSQLVQKDPAYYRPYFPDVPIDLPYIWPEGG